MSLNTSTPLIPLAPPGTIWVAAVGPAIGFLMIAATMGSALVVMLAALFFFSTPDLWKKPVFILNVFSLLVGITYASILIYEQFHALLHPTTLLDPKLSLAIAGFDGFIPTLIDSILLLRLYAVYPYDRTPRLKFLFIMSIPVLIKIGRIINASSFLNDYANTIAATNNIGGSAAVLLTIRSPFIKVEWSLQILDDVWSSLIFLIHIYRRSVFRRDRSVSQTVRSLFWIAATNFVFPVVLSVVQLTLYFARPDNYLIAVYIDNINIYSTIIGVVFATLWVAEGRWEKNHHLYSASDLTTTERSDPSSNPPLSAVTKRPSNYSKGQMTFAPTRAVGITVEHSTEVHSYPNSTNASNDLTKIQTSSSAYELGDRDTSAMVV